MPSPAPNEETIRTYLNRIFRRPLAEYPTGQIEISWMHPTSGERWQHAYFDLSAPGLNAAAVRSLTINRSGYNLYVGINPRKPGVTRFATNDDVEAAWWCFGDVDQPDSLPFLQHAVKRLPCTLSVVTGVTPSKRVHAYWELDEPTRNLPQWTAQQAGIAAAIHGDAVTDPRRIMRIPGTVNWPSEKKQARGYTAELTTLKTQWHGEERDPVSSEAIRNAFPPVYQSQKQDEQDNTVGSNVIDLQAIPAFRDDAPNTDIPPAYTLFTPTKVNALIDAIANNINWHDHMVRLTAHWIGRGWTDREILCATSALTLQGYTRLQTAREVRKLVDSGRKKFGKPEEDHDLNENPDAAHANRIETFVDLASARSAVVKDRQWVIEDWLPTGYVTLFPGSGGLGKTLLGQQLQIATATGNSFLNLKTTPCKSIALYCEDDHDELMRRAQAIRLHYGCPDTPPGIALWQPRAGEDNVLCTFKDGMIVTTPLWDFILHAMETTRAKLLILDNAAQLFGGNENDRSQVTQFVNKLGRIAVQFQAAVLLMAHPGKSAIGLTSEFSGSTGWDACVRSRWFFRRPEAEPGDDDLDLVDIRVLRRAKANYAAIGSEITLRWERSAFVVEDDGQGHGQTDLPDRVDQIAQQAANAEDDGRFMQALDLLSAQGRAVSESPRSSRYAPKIMRLDRHWTGERRAYHRISAAMDRLFAAGIIAANVRVGATTNRHALYGIGRVEAEAATAVDTT